MAIEDDTTPDALAVVGDVLSAYDDLEMPVERYLLTILAPSVLLFFVSIVGVLLAPFPLLVRLPIPLLGTIVLLTALIYPKIVVGQRKTDMENRFHLLVTHMTVLSTTNIDRMEVFRRLAQEEEYGTLAEEINRVTQLVDTWNQSLDDALRRRAKQVPSKPVSDFFERLAYTLGAGQALNEFLLSEQSVMIENYATTYESALNNLEVMQDLYLSMILSMTFALVFATVLPVLTGTDPTMTVSAVIVLVVFIQAGFYLAIRSLAPRDPIWYHPADVTDRTARRLRLGFVASVVLSAVLIVVTAGGMFGVLPFGIAALVPGVASIPTPFKLAIPVTPLLIPGLLFRNEEERIKGRDREFPSFIRALGASESAKQSTTSAVLEGLRRKDFGALSDNINALYKRLNMRIDAPKSWTFFATETRSYLIQKFSDMYLTGRQMGGEPRQLGELISENMNEILQLRQRRQQSTVTLIGLLYGITAASTFAFFIGLTVVKILANLSLGLESTSRFDVTALINTAAYDIPLVQYLLLTVVMFNALLSSLMIREVDGGHKANAYIHFVLLVWLGTIVAHITKSVVGGILAV